MDMQLVAVVLGWVLGIGTNVITDALTRRRKLKDMKRAISRELRELKARMVAVVYRLEPLTREKLEWVQTNSAGYDGPNETPLAKAGIAGLLKAPDDQLAVAAQQYERERQGTSMFMPRAVATYTSSVVSELQEAEPDYTVHVLDVLTQIQMIEDIRDHMIFFNQQTFTPGLSEGNHGRARQNVELDQQWMAQRARILVGKIAELERRYPSK